MSSVRTTNFDKQLVFRRRRSTAALVTIILPVVVGVLLRLISIGHRSLMASCWFQPVDLTILAPKPPRSD